MNEFWRLGLRSIFAVGLTLSLLIGAGCGHDDNDDNGGPGTDTTPTAFSLTPQTSVPLNTAVTSAPITVSGIDAAAPISVTGGSYSINGGTFTSTAGTVTNGQTVAVRHTSATTNSTVTTSTLTIGGVSAPFISITQAPAGADTTPAAFTFTPLTGSALNTALTSNAITVTGIDTPVPITITGGTYSINGAAFTSNAGVVSNGQTVVVRQTTSGVNNTPTTATVTIGGVSAPFTTTTLTVGGNDTTPNAFTFTNMTSVAVSTVVTSAPITVSGITAPAPITVTGGTYAINGGTFTSAAGTVTNGQTVAVRHTSSASNSTVTTTTLTIGGVSGAFTSTTEAAAPTLNAFEIYQTKAVPGTTNTCASCHRLGTLDTTGTGPDLAGTVQMPLRYPNPGQPGHFGIVLTAEEIAALTALFLAQ
jgi:hypothetical protein